MKTTILMSNCWEILPNNKGYIHTHLDFNRETNEIESLRYVYSKTLSSDNVKRFTSYEELQSFISNL